MITELPDVMDNEDIANGETDSSMSIKVPNIFHIKDLQLESFDDEKLRTTTSLEQKRVERSVGSLLHDFLRKAAYDPENPLLLRDLHIQYLTQSIKHLPPFYQCLDASRPWLCYWVVHSLVLLDHSFNHEDALHIATFLGRCQNADGGFGGGPGQISHLAPTYAAVNALCSLAVSEAFKVINRVSLKKFLRSVRQEDGSYCMHVGGELDIRGVYCAACVAKLTNVYTDDLFSGSAEWIVSCQTYEGGFGGMPGMEAHGGYAFCAIAALALLRKHQLCDIKSLLRWTVNRQMRFEGGFQGRTNKLVDGCYSFWQGGAFPIIQSIISVQDGGSGTFNRWLFHSSALQHYILVCCQSPTGGLLDKPFKPRDIYHSCYTLSGLAIAQHQPLKPNVLGHADNLLKPIHPLYNIGQTQLNATLDFFMQQQIPR